MSAVLRKGPTVPGTSGSGLVAECNSRNAEHEALELLASVWPADVPLDCDYLRHVLKVRGIGDPGVNALPLTTRNMAWACRSTVGLEAPSAMSQLPVHALHRLLQRGCWSAGTWAERSRTG